MSETKKQATLDLSKGVAASALTDGGMILGRVGDQDVVLARRATRCSPSARTVRTTAARSWRG